jgi:hypothetical protein
VGRTHSPKGQIVLKKKEKLEAVKAVMPAGCPPENFAVKFQEMYPKDWDKIVRRFQMHEAHSEGKGHPMAQPWQYLMNMVKVFLMNNDAAA